MPYDVKRELKSLYAPKHRDWALVEVPPQRFLAVDGRGDPNTAAAYREAVEALYTVAYTARAAVKRAGGEVFTVGPLEGLWWSDDLAAFTARDKGSWQWRMLIDLPSWVDEAAAADAAAAAAAKKPELAAIANVRVVSLTEGRCAQVLHVGSYDDEAPVLEELHERFLPDNGLVPTGPHHEVYLGDPRKTDPSRLTTVLRQPVARA